MGHEIYAEKFYGHRTAGWHQLGIVSQIPRTGPEVADTLGLPQVYTEGLRTDSGVSIPTHKAIMGLDKGVASLYSIVSNDYQETTHFDFVQAVDRATGGHHVETMGLLGNGATLFVTLQLPDFDIRGVAHQDYLLAVNPLTGINAIYGRRTTIRVVCANTLRFSASNFLEEFRCVHTSDQARQIEHWMSELWSRTLMQGEAMREAYNVLAARTVTQAEAQGVISEAYPTDQKPEADARSDEGLKQLAEWEKDNKAQVVHQENTYNLFAGYGRGSKEADTNGTAYGVYNAVAEYEQFGKKHGRAASAIFGAGQLRTEKAFTACMELVKAG